MAAYEVPLAEITLKATPSSGPGGQHVNRSSTRIEATWNVLESPTLSEAQRHRLLRKLGKRIAGDGTLRVVADGERSQAQNRAGAIARLRAVVADALVVPRTRKPTRPTKASVERRITEKKQRGRRKAERREPADE